MVDLSESIPLLKKIKMADAEAPPKAILEEIIDAVVPGSVPDSNVAMGNGATGHVTTATDSSNSSMAVSAVLPRLPVFSGQDKDTPFDVWRFEVQCLQSEGRSENDIKLAIRRSLKGQASRTLLSLGVEAAVSNIIKKFNAVYGSTETAHTILRTFYSLSQREGEDAGSFAVRLEDCIQQAVRLGRVNQTSVPFLLKEAFGGGLLHRTKMATAYLFAQFDQFDALQVEVKRVEKELGLLNTASAMAIQSSQQNEIDKLTATVNELKTELTTLKAKQLSVNQQNHTNSQRHRPPPDNGVRTHNQRPCWRCGVVGHYRRECRVIDQNLNGQRPVWGGNSQVRPTGASWGNQQR